MRSIGMQVRAVSFKGSLIEVKIPKNELVELFLDIRQLGIRKFELIQSHLTGQ